MSSEAQQVMSAQAGAHPLVNGTGEVPLQGPAESTEAPSSSIRSDVADRALGENVHRTASTMAGGLVSDTQALVDDVPTRPTTSGAGLLREQAQQQAVATTLDDGQGTGRGMGEVEQATTSYATFLTPRSTASPPQPPWLAGLEVPSWMNRLTSYLNLGYQRDPLAPSPLGQAVTSSPPGGPTFVLRSPQRSRPTRTATPPSSSVPAEAIQLEVQRQLGGLIERLRQVEQENDQLRGDLYTARLAAVTEERLQPTMFPMAPYERAQRGNEPQGAPTCVPDSAGTQGPRLEPQRELGDLRQAPSDPQRTFIPGPPRPPQPPEQLQPGQSGGLWGNLLTAPSGPTPPPPAINVQPFEEQRQNSGGNQGAAEQPGFLRSWLGSRARTPSPPAPAQQSPGSPMDTLAKGIQQLQELQAQALARSATSSTSMELVKHGTMTLAALPDMKVGCEAALDFQDWLEVAATSLSDLSEQSGEWWRAVIASTEETYRKWLAATPLERLSLAPDNTEALTSGRWQRLNARVSALLLSAMGVDLRADMISQRISQDAVKMTYRLYTWFQPGGSDEREDVLRRLQNPQEYVPYSTVQDALKALRAWPRWLARCKAVGMAAPDPSVLARGLKGITQAHIDKSGDASFRTSMVRTTLRLDAQPTVDQVLAYQRHLQAELETMAAGKTTTSPTTSPPKLRAIEKGSAKGKGKDGDKEKAVEMCKYFLKASGCKRGSRCVYSHSMQNLDRDIRARKCLSCGSESHRQRECPVNKPTSKAGAPSPSGGKGGKPDKAQEGTTSSTTSTAPTVAAMHGSTTSSSQVVEGTPWTLEALVQAAHQVVQQQQGTSSAREGDSSPEKTRADLKTLVVKDIRVCSLQSMSMALLDSGATPCLRRATTSSEWNGAEQVMVQLAGTHTLLMRMSDTGTLLMPPRAESSSSEASSPGAGQTIVPIGQLVQTLGYSLHWTPGSCYLVDAEGVKIPLKVKSGCPQLQEVEALALIARIEERRKECLENQTLVLQDKIECASLVMEKTWEDHLRVYAQNGYMGDGLRALRDAPFLEDLPMECLSGLVPADVQESGWEILKWISFLNRSQRRRMLMAKRWVIHLFAGEPGHYEMFKLDQHGTVVLELDVHRCRGQDIYRPEVWRMLMWGARMGKIDVIMGGPPGRHKGSFGHDGVLPDDLRPLSAITRMTWLHAVAEAGRLVHGATCEKRRPVGFVVEHPEHEVDVVGHPLGTCSRTDSLWTTTVWRVYSEVGGLRAASFDQGPMGSSTRNPTTLGTNVDHLLSLHELRQQPEQDDQVRGTTPPHVWSPGLVRALVVALTFWDRGRRQYPMVRAMTPEQWKAHVASNHEHYRRDCVTCVMARGTGQRHMKVKHPDSYVLTTDLAGPVRAGLDPTSKGKMGKGLKYMLVAKYIVPKEFMKGRVNKEPPDDLGAPPSSSGLSTKEKELEQDLFGDSQELTRQSSKPPPHGDGSDHLCEVNEAELPEGNDSGGLQSKDQLVIDSEELRQSSTPPPRDGSFLFEHVPAEPGPVVSEHVPAEPGPAEQGDAWVEAVGGEDIERSEDAVNPNTNVIDEEETLDYEPSYAGDSEVDDLEPHEDPLSRPSHAVMEAGDCLPPEQTYLLFGVGLPNNLSATVKAAIQDIVLYLRAHGLPVVT